MLPLHHWFHLMKPYLLYVFRISPICKCITFARSCCPFLLEYQLIKQLKDFIIYCTVWRKSCLTFSLLSVKVTDGSVTVSSLLSIFCTALRPGSEARPFAHQPRFVLSQQLTQAFLTLSFHGISVTVCWPLDYFNSERYITLSACAHHPTDVAECQTAKRLQLTAASGFKNWCIKERSSSCLSWNTSANNCNHNLDLQTTFISYVHCTIIITKTLFSQVIWKSMRSMKKV